MISLGGKVKFRGLLTIECGVIVAYYNAIVGLTPFEYYYCIRGGKMMGLCLVKRVIKGVYLAMNASFEL